MIRPLSPVFPSSPGVAIGRVAAIRVSSPTGEVPSEARRRGFHRGRKSAKLQSVPRPRHTRLAHVRSHQLRIDLTISEARVWAQLKGRKLGARFRRQVPIGIWIVDFACLERQLIIEIDDKSHDSRDETRRTQYLEAQGFSIIRFTNKEVAMDLDGVVWVIRQALDG